MTSRLIISRQVMISNIALPGLLTRNNEMLAAIYINPQETAKHLNGCYHAKITIVGQQHTFVLTRPSCMVDATFNNIVDRS